MLLTFRGFCFVMKANLLIGGLMKKIWKISALTVILVAIGTGVGFYYLNKPKLEPLMQEGQPFDFEMVRAKARGLAASPYMPQKVSLPEEVAGLDYDQHRDIRFVRDKGPWFGQQLPFEIQLFHLGSIFTSPVKINEIKNGRVKPLNYSASYFDFGKNRVHPDKWGDVGFAGFRLHYPLNTSKYMDELVSFLGASYFRALGKGQKYGLSARGLAIDTAVQTGEEFPVFEEFWVEKPKPGAAEIKVYALLNSKSVTGAYSFTIQPGLSTTMDGDATLYPRENINKLGIAPLTSMFLFGENSKNKFDDHRMEVHDSDGLLVWNGNDEWLWRPLDNSKYLRISSFEDNNPHGFGLLQRDRKPEHYLDFEAMYEQRPSLWVEPLENWGKGVVQLVEIPSIQEIHDNIVAFWIPDQKIEAGKEYHFSYRLHWTGDAPIESNLAKVTATYTGIGGVSGMLNVDKRKFVIDFSAPKIKGLNWEQEIKDGKITADISISEGKFLGSHLMFNPVTKAPTLYMDFRPNGKTAEIRAVLRREGQVVSEVWSYQWLP